MEESGRKMPINDAESESEAKGEDTVLVGRIFVQSAVTRR